MRVMVLLSSSGIILPSKGAPNPGPRQAAKSQSSPSRGSPMLFHLTLSLLSFFCSKSAGVSQHFRPPHRASSVKKMKKGHKIKWIMGHHS
jgi:hypothetical protein